MADSQHLECAFFIPVRRDANLSDGLPHVIDAWEWLDDQLFERFFGGTMETGLHGFYRDPDTGERVYDDSYRFTVAVRSNSLDALRMLLQEACQIFQQKCIYLSIAGHVEFVEPSHESE